METAWLTENGDTLLLFSALLLFAFRTPILARFFGIQTLSVHDLAKRLASATPPLLIDVRTPQEYQAGHVPHAISVPLKEIRPRMAELRQKCPDREVVVICQSGARSLRAAVVLKRSGFAPVHNITGGTFFWKMQGYELRN